MKQIGDCGAVNSRILRLAGSFICAGLCGSVLRAADTLPASDHAATLAGVPATIPSDPGSEFQFGGDSPWRFVPQLTVLATYDDNVFITPTNKVADEYFHIAPGFAVGVGDFRGQVTPYASIPHLLAQTGEEDLPRANFFYVNYTPDFEVFTHNSRENTVNQDVKLAGQQQGELWRLQGMFHYQLVTDPNIYLGNRARQTYYNADIDGSYQLTGKLNSGLLFEGNRAQIVGGFNQQQARAVGYLDYEQSEKTTVGLGLGVGGLEVSSDPNQTYFQALLRFKYNFTEKIWVSGNAGADFRHLGQGAGNRTGGIFDVTLDYAATESTQLSVTARRATVAAEEYHGVNIWEGVYQAGLRQRVGSGFAVSGTGGLVWDQYVPFAQGVVLNRRDRYYFYRGAVGHDVTKRGTAQIAYEHRENDSSVRNFWFTENLVTLNLSFLF